MYLIFLMSFGSMNFQASDSGKDIDLSSWFLQPCCRLELGNLGNWPGPPGPGINTKLGGVGIEVGR